MFLKTQEEATEEAEETGAYFQDPNETAWVFKFSPTSEGTVQNHDKKRRRDAAKTKRRRDNAINHPSVTLTRFLRG